MITKIVYFRPDKRFVSDEDLGETFNCFIKDEYTTVENCITFPVYLTVFQHNIPKGVYKMAKSRSEIQPPPSSYRFLEKICFYSVGSLQVPQLTELSLSVRNIDRVEFKGHVGFEEPIFAIISQLPALRKVSFFVDPCKQRKFITDSNFDMHNIKEGESCVSSPRNLLVTNFKILIEKCASTSCDCTIEAVENENEQRNLNKMVPEDGVNSKPGFTKSENLKLMITRILQRMVAQCPNVKHLHMDVPNYIGIRKTIDSSIEKLASLKPTKVSCINGQVLVRKRAGGSDDMSPSKAEHPQVDPATTIEAETAVQLTKNETIPLENTVPKIESENDTKNDDNDNENLPVKSQGITDEPESTTCLLDMSKLLGSMLGIPTSSLSPASMPQLQSSNTQVPHQNSLISAISNKTNEPQNLNDTQLLNSGANGGVATITNTTTTTTQHTKTSSCSMNSTVNNQCATTTPSSSSTMEVITYAAAAASAAATNTISTSTSNSHHRHQRGNDIGSHNLHHRHHHHINEGSRRTFLREGVNEEESIRNKKKPSVTHAADLGKPVFVSSPICIKRGI